MRDIVVTVTDLTRLIESVFLLEGLDANRAREATEVLIYADLAGLDTHGVLNLLPIYIEGFRTGSINPNAEWVCIRDHQAVQVFDAGKMLGLCAGRLAMQATLKRARQFGIAATTVNNSTHFGAAGYYAAMALKENMIGMAMTNLGAKPVAHAMGSKRTNVGTNPISFAAPVENMPDFVLDVSTTICSSGKIKQARTKQCAVPDVWLLDQTGHGVTDPEAYFAKQAFIPTLGGWHKDSGAHKGYGLNLMVEILAGVLANADLAPLSRRHTHNDIGHFFIAMDINAWLPVATFKQRMTEMLDTYLAEPVFDGFPGLNYPGYPDASIAEERKSKGLPLPENLFNQLNHYAVQHELVCLKEKSL